jgi:16S rRNA processing protein RimM
VYINQQPMTVAQVEWHKGNAIIKLNAIDSVAAAQGLKGQLVEIHHSQLKPLPEGQYYHFQLIGLEVRTAQGELLGTVTEILNAESNDIYIVQGDRGEILIPAIGDVIKAIELDKGRIIIEPIEGLLS